MKSHLSYLLAVSTLFTWVTCSPSDAAAVQTTAVQVVGSPALFLDSNGRATVVGRVQARVPVERVGVAVALLDKAGKRLTILQAPTLLREVAAGEQATYRFQSDGMSGTGYWPTAVRAEVVATAAAPATRRVDHAYRVAVAQSRTALGVQQLDGTVSGPAGDQLLVAFTFFDARGKVVDAGTAFSRGGRRLGTHDAAPFTLRRYVDEESRQPAWVSHEVIAEGDSTNPVPAAVGVRPVDAGSTTAADFGTRVPVVQSRLLLAGAVSSTGPKPWSPAQPFLLLAILSAVAGGVQQARR